MCQSLACQSLAKDCTSPGYTNLGSGYWIRLSWWQIQDVGDRFEMLVTVSSANIIVAHPELRGLKTFLSIALISIRKYQFEIFVIIVTFCIFSYFNYTNNKWKINQCWNSDIRWINLLEFNSPKNIWIIIYRVI